MDKKKTVLLILALCAVILILVLLLVLRGGLNASPQVPELVRTEDGVILLTPAPAPTATPAPGDETEETEPPAAVTTEAAAAPTPGEDPSVPERKIPAEPSYFADAVFIGNETVMALGRYDYDGLLTEAAFYEVETVSDTSFVQKIKKDGGYGKVYIGLGGYELAYRVSDLRDSLESAIRSLKAEYPGTIIYLMSVSPVSKYRESVSKALRMDRLPEYNDMLYELAAESGVWYIEITSALVDEEGYLPSDVTEDGLNYTPGHYAGWYERIASHYIGETE